MQSIGLTGKTDYQSLNDELDKAGALEDVEDRPDGGEPARIRSGGSPSAKKQKKSPTGKSGRSKPKPRPKPRTRSDGTATPME